MAIPIPEVIITLDSESIDFNEKGAVKTHILKLLNVLEAQIPLIGESQNKKLNPLIDYHRILLQEFITRVWAFYDRLNDFRKNPYLISQNTSLKPTFY